MKPEIKQYVHNEVPVIILSVKYIKIPSLNKLAEQQLMKSAKCFDVNLQTYLK